MALGSGWRRHCAPWSGRARDGMPLPPELAEGGAIIDSQSVKTTEKGGLAAMTRARGCRGASATS